jgi:hypothetical protein
MMEGEPIAMVNGYPDAVSIASTLPEHADFTLSTPSGTAVFSRQSARGSSVPNCFVTYTPPASPNSPPAVATTIGGC